MPTRRRPADILIERAGTGVPARGAGQGHRSPVAPRRVGWGEHGLLGVGLTLAIASGVVAYRAGGPYGERFERDPRIGRVAVGPALSTEATEALAVDTTGDLRFDTWTHVRGDRVVMTAQDTDADGRADAWQYYRADESLARFEKDTDGDGIPDVRTKLAADGDRMLSLEYDGNADGRIDTWEYYRKDETIERMDEDSDGDGRPDYRWVFSPEEIIVAEFILDPAETWPTNAFDD